MRQRVINILQGIIPTLEFTGDGNLIEEGLLDSLDVVMLTYELEKEFRVKIDGADVKASNFNTVDDIVNMLIQYGADES